LAFAIFAGAFGSAFQHGYNTGVLNAPQTLISTWIQNCSQNVDEVVAARPGMTLEEYKGQIEACGCDMDESEVTNVYAVIVAMFCVGGMLGGVSVGLISAKLGR